MEVVKQTAHTLRERQVHLAQVLQPSHNEGGMPLRDDVGGRSGVTSRAVPLLPGRPVVHVGGVGMAFSRLGGSVQDIADMYSWATDSQVL